MQKITTPKGETLVVLPLKDYERLVDASDITAANKVRRDVKAGRDEMIPADVVKRIIAGENTIRVWREYRGLTARDLAAKTDLSAAYISEIETGKKDGSISAARRIARVLKVDPADLI